MRDIFKKINETAFKEIRQGTITEDPYKDEREMLRDLSKHSELSEEQRKALMRESASSSLNKKRQRVDPKAEEKAERIAEAMIKREIAAGRLPKPDKMNPAQKMMLRKLTGQ